MLQTNLCGIELKNPLVLASGILGVSKPCLTRMGHEGAGAVTIKSLSMNERKGHPSPTMFTIDGAMLNAVGLPGQGIKSASKDFETLDDVGVPVIGSLFGATIDEFQSVAQEMAKLRPAMIEVNVSCPNIDYHKPFFADADAIEEITRKVKAKAKGIPVTTKLSPNVHNIAELAMAAKKGGADAITAINTAWGMHINIDARRPVLANKQGGLSGPAIKPIAIRSVYEVYKATKLPIIGTGGVSCAKDAIEMMMAGAAAVGIGTACYYEGPSIFQKIQSQMQEWMRKNNIANVSDLVGVAHEN